MQNFIGHSFYCVLYFLLIILCLIFLGALLVYTPDARASQSLCDGNEKMHHELFSGKIISDFEYRQNFNNGVNASAIFSNSSPSAVSVKLESVFPLFFYVGTNREFLKKTKYRLFFNNSENTPLDSGSLTIPLLAIKGTIHPGATQMGFSLLSLLHLPFFQSGRFGLGQR
jgi:hypothetical protein